MQLTARLSILFLLVIARIAAQSKDDEESMDVTHKNAVEGSGNAPSDDEDTVEGSGLPPSQVYTKQTTIVHARPAVPIKATTVAPEIPKKKDALPPIINMDDVDKEQKEKEKDQQPVSIAPAIPRITTNRPDTGFFANTNIVLFGVLGLIIVLIIIVIIIIVVCRRKHKSDYTPGRPSPTSD